MAVPTFQDLPLGARDRDWDGDAAEQRVRKWAKAQDGPNAAYRDAHVWYDASAKENFGSYKLLIADVVSGKLKAMPRGDGRGRGDAGVPRRGRPSAARHHTGQEPLGQVLPQDG